MTDNMPEHRFNSLRRCPECGQVPDIGYLSCNYIIQGTPSCPVCGNSYTEGHSTEYDMVVGWNKRVARFLGETTS